MFGSKPKSLIGESFSYLLLFLFIGYYGSITFFNHSHIVNGVTIVHSHPFNKEKNGNFPGSPHNDKELVVIQLLSDFLTTIIAVTFAIFLLRALLFEISVISTEDGYAQPGGFCTFPLRAPPCKMQS